MDKRKVKPRPLSKPDKNFDDVANYVLKRYLESRDFNGVPLGAIEKEFHLNSKSLLEVLSRLINEKKLCLVYGDIHPNPHIKAFADETIEKQLYKLVHSASRACAYPAKGYSGNILDPSNYKGKPYDYELALGAGQLEHKAFDLSVLEAYRNDPRYIYHNWDIGGRICISDDYYQSEDMAEHDQILLQTYGFCYDKKLNRAVAVFLRYLKDLSPEHQQIWKSKELSGEYFLHPDYHRTSLIGDFPEKLSLADAFLLELDVINKMCIAMGRSAFFNETFKDNKPRDFTFLVRPTLNEFNFFVQTLDKMMSDNINKKFFKDDLSLEQEEIRSDGKIVISQKSTITLLEEWTTTYFKPEEMQPISEMLSAFREVRKLRQKPAHTIKPDEFNQKYFHEQRELFKRAYNAISTIRLIFANHPDVIKANIKINVALLEGRIWTF